MLCELLVNGTTTTTPRLSRRRRPLLGFGLQSARPRPRQREAPPTPWIRSSRPRPRQLEAGPGLPAGCVPGPHPIFHPLSSPLYAWTKSPSPCLSGSKSPAPCFSCEEQDSEPNGFERQEADADSGTRAPLSAFHTGPAVLPVGTLAGSGHRVLWAERSGLASHRKRGLGREAPGYRCS